MSYPQMPRPDAQPPAARQAGKSVYAVRALEDHLGRIAEERTMRSDSVTSYQREVAAETERLAELDAMEADVTAAIARLKAGGA